MERVTFIMQWEILAVYFIYLFTGYDGILLIFVLITRGKRLVLENVQWFLDA